ncbi:Predicted dehydrogenase [Plantibacter sp. VKM Ac-1784]|uniref:Predicted dehydrogenase n=1 Tax=Plantibacter elymi (nom. nud.) TaxID=199708 RepID=A0ABY1RD60_9MICO|nr:Gfo/Idh/MocA family oxidoreductase [Plantibacter sp. VKM Ac-1784]SMQ70709.1 Predicted dehydrogenase [Plantibacter sp. VKM Ac-1784]
MGARKRFVVVGAGMMGTNHARVVAQSESAELAVLVDPRSDVGTRLAEQHGASWAPELPSLDGIDGVIVAAATEAHHELAMQVLAAGVPLLIEKPIAAGIEHSREVVATAEANDIPLMCGLLERFNPAVLTARSFIETPIHISAIRHSPYAPRIRTGVAWDLLVHDVDLAIVFAGGVPETVSSTLGHFHPSSLADAEDVAETILGFDTGAIAHISASRMGQKKIRQVSVSERERLIEIDLLRRDVTVYRHVSEDLVAGAHRGYRQQTVIEIPEMVTSVEPLTAQFAHFCGIIDGSIDAGKERRSLLPAHEVIAKVLDSAPAMA